MTRKNSAWQPDWSVPPGEILADELESRGMSQTELARRMGRPTKTINEIVNAKAAITPDTAFQLELVVDIPARLWLSLEAGYREHLARGKAVAALGEDTDWAKAFPLADLRRYKLLDPGLRDGDLVAAVLRFFGVSSVSAWLEHWGQPAAAFRHSPSFESKPEALATWLRWGERYAMSVETAPFDAEKLRSVLADARSMTREEPLSDVLEELQERLADCGVVLALIPGLKGTAVSGAARWLTGDRALIQLSMRYRSDDHLWFTLFHEAAHLLEGRHEDRLDDDSRTDPEDEVERRVDTRARELLLPGGAYEEFVNAGAFDESAVRAFAKAQGIAPGIVVGCLEHDRHIKQSALRHLKKPLEWH